MTGGAGNDTFGVSEHFANDAVTDFVHGQDKLRVEGFGPDLDSVADLRAAGGIDRTDNGILLTLPDETTVTVVLEDFNSNLTAGDFIFVT